MRAAAEDLYDTLVRGLSLGSNKAAKHAAAYLAEDTEITIKRKHLTEKKERLDVVLKELFKLGM